MPSNYAVTASHGPREKLGGWGIFSVQKPEGEAHAGTLQG